MTKIVLEDNFQIYEGLYLKTNYILKDHVSVIYQGIIFIFSVTSTHTALSSVNENDLDIN